MKFGSGYEEMREWSDDTYVLLIRRGLDMRFLSMGDLRFLIEADSGGNSIEN